MQLSEIIVSFYLLTVNFAALICFGLDKLFAKNRSFRIRESWLISLSLLGGSIGALVGMVLFHHKISKPKFRYLVPVLFLIQITLIFLYLLQVAYGIQL